MTSFNTEPQRLLPHVDSSIKGEAEVENQARIRLDAGELALGVGLRQARTNEIPAVMEVAGFDFLFIDLEHNPLSVESASDLCVAACGGTIAPIVRVPEGQYWLATRLLDGGAKGIIVPHVDTPAEARNVVSKLRYPPRGNRSYSSMQTHSGFQDVSIGDLTARVDAGVLVAIMLETREAVDNCEEIAAVEGIDVVMIGANDLCLDLGIPGQVAAEPILTAAKRVAEACKSQGRHLGIGGVRTVDDLALYFDMGYRFIFCADDTRLLTTGGQARTTALRNSLKSVAVHP
jgi:4-hydroxy-2-oxoheptanedioate aldolase